MWKQEIDLPKKKNPSNITHDNQNQEKTNIKNMYFKGKPHEPSNGIQLEQQITTWMWKKKKIQNI